MKRYLKIGITGAAILASGILCAFVLFKMPVIISVLKGITEILKPFLYGVVFAYLLAPLCNKIEEKLFQFFPKAINRTQEQITGLEQDLAVVQAHPLPDKEHFSITVAGQTYTERKAAGQAIIDACTKMTDVAERVPLGEYRGFPMTLWADTSTQKFQVTMKHSLSHTIELGSDPVGNIARLENALAAIADNLEQNRGKLENLNAQMEEAKLEVKRPFPQEQELAEKTSRLNVLRIALNMDGKSSGKRERDNEELDGGKPSIKGMLKRLGVESAATASPPQKGKDMEVAI